METPERRVSQQKAASDSSQRSWSNERGRTAGLNTQQCRRIAEHKAAAEEARAYKQAADAQEAAYMQAQQTDAQQAAAVIAQTSVDGPAGSPLSAPGSPVWAPNHAPSREGSTEFHVGRKHYGKTYAQVAAEDPDYCKWVAGLSDPAAAIK